MKENELVIVEREEALFPQRIYINTCKGVGGTQCRNEVRT